MRQTKIELTTHSLAHDHYFTTLTSRLPLYSILHLIAPSSLTPSPYTWKTPHHTFTSIPSLHASPRPSMAAQLDNN